MREWQEALLCTVHQGRVWWGEGNVRWIFGCGKQECVSGGLFPRDRANCYSYWAIIITELHSRGTFHCMQLSAPHNCRLKHPFTSISRCLNSQYRSFPFIYIRSPSDIKTNITAKAWGSIPEHFSIQSTKYKTFNPFLPEFI